MTAVREEQPRGAVDLSQPALPKCTDGHRNHIIRRNKEHSMMDFLMIALAIGFFALGIGYTYVCERL